jgi:hypothetical protein
MLLVRWYILKCCGIAGKRIFWFSANYLLKIVYESAQHSYNISQTLGRLPVVRCPRDSQLWTPSSGDVFRAFHLSSWRLPAWDRFALLHRANIEFVHSNHYAS